MPRTKSTALLAAEALAEFFLPGIFVEGIDLVGSVAREGDGRNVNLVIVIDEDETEVYLDMLRRYWNTDELLARVVSSLGLSTDDLKSARIGVDVSVLAFPRNWQLSFSHFEDMPFSDPNFLHNLACDARRYDPRLREFEAF